MYNTCIIYKTNKSKYVRFVSIFYKFIPVIYTCSYTRNITYFLQTNINPKFSLFFFRIRYGFLHISRKSALFNHNFCKLFETKSLRLLYNSTGIWLNWNRKQHDMYRHTQFIRIIDSSCISIIKPKHYCLLLNKQSMLILLISECMEMLCIGWSRDLEELFRFIGNFYLKSMVR